MRKSILDIDDDVKTGIDMKKYLTMCVVCMCLAFMACSGGNDRHTGEKVNVGLIFVPNVQFAPFYVAMHNNYYSEEGLDVSFEFSSPADAIQFAGIGKFDFIIGDGEQVIIARDRGLPVRYILSLYSKYPVAIASLSGSNIAEPRDLSGKTVGIPEYAGASWIGFKSFLKATGIDESDLEPVAIGYTQSAALAQGRVDAAVVYINNAPVQLRMAGESIRLMRVDDHISLVSAGVITNDALIENRPVIVEKFTRATRRGIEFVKANPPEALDICFQFISEGGENRKVQYEVLKESIKLYDDEFSVSAGTGASDPGDWANTQSILFDLKLIKEKKNIDVYFTNKYIINNN
ncbi:MAG: ABC transporter substrate-binding protein [candidate division KSB1 bacterium]|jgi:NitT/TauT family transport system substrate-binding protein|nr:ABC transporter substrate-binding protein [candidate division KSB1 bacterium]